MTENYRYQIRPNIKSIKKPILTQFRSLSFYFTKLRFCDNRKYLAKITPFLKVRQKPRIICQLFFDKKFFLRENDLTTILSAKSMSLKKSAKFTIIFTIFYGNFTIFFRKFYAFFENFQTFYDFLTEIIQKMFKKNSFFRRKNFGSNNIL